MTLTLRAAILQSAICKTQPPGTRCGAAYHSLAVKRAVTYVVQEGTRSMVIWDVMSPSTTLRNSRAGPELLILSMSLAKTECSYASVTPFDVGSCKRKTPKCGLPRRDLNLQEQSNICGSGL